MKYQIGDKVAVMNYHKNV